MSTNRALLLGRLHKTMFSECKRLQKDLGYIPPLTEVIMNSKTLKAIIIRPSINEMDVEKSYESVVEDMGWD